jgi:dienelactone hydrolase
MQIRAMFRAAKVETASSPYDTIHIKVFYPARFSESDREQNLGEVPADAEQAPFPVVIFFNGINCGAELYQWLAVKLAERGFVVLTFAWVAENLPGMVTLTPGVDLQAWMPDTYGTRPTASALPALLKELQHMQTQGILAGLLAEQVVLGGHSAGGRVAIESADPQFFPQVVASFAYGAHTAAVTQLGYPPSTVLPLPSALPLLLLGGTRDGVIAHSGDRYGSRWETPTTPIVRTFHEAIEGGREDSYLLLLEGANHFSIAHPFDSTTGRSFLDLPASQPDTQIRDQLAEVIGIFIDAHVRQKPSAFDALKQLKTVRNPLISLFEQK